jgi:hypothetical protein
MDKRRRLALARIALIGKTLQIPAPSLPHKMPTLSTAAKQRHAIRTTCCFEHSVCAIHWYQFNYWPCMPTVITGSPSRLFLVQSYPLDELTRFPLQSRHLRRRSHVNVHSAEAAKAASPDIWPAMIDRLVGIIGGIAIVSLLTALLGPLRLRLFSPNQVGPSLS